MKQQFNSPGKLLLTGEYVVLDGATGLAVPTKFGQFLRIEPSSEAGVHWTSMSVEGDTWFDHHFSFRDLESIDPTAMDSVAGVLLNLLRLARESNKSFLDGSTNYRAISKMDFPRDWGLGSSSTLINNIAQWAKVDPYILLEKTFGGSGYDIAVAQYGAPLLYTSNAENRDITTANLDWGFVDELFFVYLNRKQDSREGIARYRGSNKGKKNAIEEISDLSRELLATSSLDDFQSLLERHEAIISHLIDLPTIKSQLFPDYPGTIKSLGAWGGDFVLATGDRSQRDYFRNKGYDTVIDFTEMIA